VGVGLSGRCIFVGIVGGKFEALPWIARLLAGSTPSQREIMKLFEGRIVVDGVVEAGEDWAAAVRHQMTEKLPVAVRVVRDIGDGLRLFVHGLGEVGGSVWIVRELPIEEAARRIIRCPEILFPGTFFGAWSEHWLPEILLKTLLVLKADIEIGVYKLQNRDVICCVITSPHAA
jgi:hypothetical protein